jgi:hypothetical protein
MSDRNSKPYFPPAVAAAGTPTISHPLYLRPNQIIRHHQPEHRLPFRIQMRPIQLHRRPLVLRLPSAPCQNG